LTPPLGKENSTQGVDDKVNGLKKPDPRPPVLLNVVVQTSTDWAFASGAPPGSPDATKLVIVAASAVAATINKGIANVAIKAVVQRCRFTSTLLIDELIAEAVTNGKQV
jgi:hypothetical protein